MDFNENHIRQYEAIRQSGLTNMYDRIRVQDIANEMDYPELASLESKEYSELHESYSELMTKFNITKDDQQIKMETAQINLLFGDEDYDVDGEDWDWCGSDEDEDDEEWEDEEFD